MDTFVTLSLSKHIGGKSLKGLRQAQSDGGVSIRNTFVTQSLSKRIEVNSLKGLRQAQSDIVVSIRNALVILRRGYNWTCLVTLSLSKRIEGSNFKRASTERTSTSSV